MDEDGHQYFDFFSCTACEEANYESDEDIRIRRRKKKDLFYRKYLLFGNSLRAIRAADQDLASYQKIRNKSGSNRGFFRAIIKCVSIYNIFR